MGSPSDVTFTTLLDLGDLAHINRTIGVDRWSVHDDCFGKLTAKNESFHKKMLQNFESIQRN
ncbi:hypothetical protein Syun_015867 [Stephania yunnanensis]|uniref:Uncharacterized protein n=1 Tax=Stephania yunnanensis TaxID=152371 RepID=A0AAP0J4V2_9MAGN